MLFHHWFQSLKNNIQNLYPYFTDKETEAQKEATYLKPPSKPVAESGAELISVLMLSGPKKKSRDE